MPRPTIVIRPCMGRRVRAARVGEIGAFGGFAGTRSGDTVAVNFQKIAPGIYKVTPNKPLAPGEYCFFYAGTNMGVGMTGGKVFDFGIDRAQ